MGNFLFGDDFGYVTANLADNYDNFGSFLSVGSFGRLGGKGVRCSDETTLFGLTQLTKTISSGATRVIGFALNLFTGYPASERVFLVLREDSTTHLTFTIAATGAIKVYRGTSSGTLLGTTGASLPASGFPHVEIKATINDSTGAVQIWFNGTGDGTTNRVLNLSGIDTRNGGTSGVIDNFRFWYDGSGTTTSLKSYLADLFVHEDTQQGDWRWEALSANADGDSSQFVGSDGNSTNNYLLVTKTNPDVTTYVDEDTAGQKDLYNFANLSVSSANIGCVIVRTYAQKTDAGTCTFTHTVKSSSTTADSSTLSPGTAATFQNTLWHTDPATSAAWTVSGVNAMQAGATRQS